MAKVNVNSATRDDLVNVAGLRPDVADAVLGFRRRHGRITDVQALEELPGIGPATIDQLRKALDVGDKGGNGGDQARAGERAAATGVRVASTTAREGLDVVRGAAGAAGTGREAGGPAAGGGGGAGPARGGPP